MAAMGGPLWAAGEWRRLHWGLTPTARWEKPGEIQLQLIDVGFLTTDGRRLAESRRAVPYPEAFALAEPHRHWF